MPVRFRIEDPLLAQPLRQIEQVICRNADSLDAQGVTRSRLMTLGTGGSTESATRS